MDGALLIHKPSGPTSHDVVQTARRVLGIRQIGHTGTLDPLAEGLLVLLIGKATKHQQAFQGHDKIYEAAIRLGIKTDTADAQGAVIECTAVAGLEASQVEAVLASLEGSHVQIPPAFSAIKINGKPAYWWARRNQPVVLSSRTVHIYALSLKSIDGSSLGIRVSCSAGTYVRALAETIAQRLGTVGHVVRLTRQSIGPWTLGMARTLAWLQAASTAEAREAIIPVGSALGVALSAAAAAAA